MKKAWSITGSVFEAGYLVATLGPSLGTPRDEQQRRELQRLMRGLAKVQRGWVAAHSLVAFHSGLPSARQARQR